MHAVLGNCSNQGRERVIKPSILPGYLASDMPRKGVRYIFLYLGVAAFGQGSDLIEFLKTNLCKGRSSLGG